MKGSSGERPWRSIPIRKAQEKSAARGALFVLGVVSGVIHLVVRFVARESLGLFLEVTIACMVLALVSAVIGMGEALIGLIRRVDEIAHGLSRSRRRRRDSWDDPDA